MAKGVIREVSSREGKLRQIEQLAKKLTLQEAEAVGIHEKFLAAKKADDKAREACETTRGAIVVLAGKAAKDVEPLELFDAADKQKAPKPEPWKGHDDPRCRLSLAETLGPTGKIAALLNEAGVRTLGELLKRMDNGRRLEIKGIGSAAETKIRQALEDFIVGCEKKGGNA